jgi:hypothetical protein
MCTRKRVRESACSGPGYEAGVRDGVTDRGFSRFRGAVETPLNLVLEAKQ